MEFVIKSFGRLKNNNKLTDYKLYIVGAKYDINYYNSLVKIIEDLKLENDVIFFGSIPYKETPRLYNSSDLVIIFSLFREGTSLAALEAMACGSLVITTDIGGLRDLPTIKANAENLDSIILNSIENRENIISKQISFVKENFDQKKWLQSWRAIIESL
jgi:glycosyltransferase involved in cell wall biosynthesis